MKFNDPTPRYTTQPNGDVTLEWLPPTALMMTAHREMEKLSEIVQGQIRSLETAQQHINFLETHIINLEKVLNDITSQQPTNGSGTDSGSADTTSTSAGESAST